MNITFMPGCLKGRMDAPASKSEAHRRMICAGLTKGDTVIEQFMTSEDTQATANCLRALGTAVELEGKTMKIRGFAAKPELLPVFDCGESGSTLRFFVPLALTLCHGGIFRMHGRLGQRPMEVYRDLFVPRGVTWRMAEGADGAAELMVSGKIRNGEYVLPGNVSSQFVSGLLFALPLLEGDSTLTVLPPVESAGYIRMTVQAIRESGVEIEEVAPYSWKIPGLQTYHAKSSEMQGDWSQAAVLLCADALGSEVEIGGLNRDTLQGDAAVLELLEKMGCTVVHGEYGISVKASARHAIDVNMNDYPDIAPMLALVCQLSEGTSVLRNCGRLRIKECDRLAGTVSILNALGGNAQEDGDDMIIHGVKALTGSGDVDTFHDHRMVMLASVAALCAAGPVRVTGAEALDKSWPAYLETYRSLGGTAK